MKIYMAIADNGQLYEDHAWWNIGAFASKEAAQEYIQELLSIIREKDNRLDELDELMNHREWTDSESKEYMTLIREWGRYWHFLDRGRFMIQEHEVRE